MASGKWQRENGQGDQDENSEKLTSRTLRTLKGFRLVGSNRQRAEMAKFLPLTTRDEQVR